MRNVVDRIGGHSSFCIVSAGVRLCQPTEIRTEWSFINHGYMQEKTLAAGWCVVPYLRAGVGDGPDGYGRDRECGPRSEIDIDR